jgi:DnaJ-class molecular chaperone
MTDLTPEQLARRLRFYQEQDEEPSGICGNCNGSGEGYADGTICTACRGMGEFPNRASIARRRADSRWD